MTQLSKAAFNTAFNTLFADNTTRDISEEDLRTFQTDIKDSAMFLTDNFIDEDSFASDSATKAPSQQSVKAYVDARTSMLQAKVTVSSAQLLTLGTVPVTIIAAPGANKYLAIHNVYGSYNYGSAAYVFGSLYPVLKTGSNISHTLLQATLEAASDKNFRFIDNISAFATLEYYTTNAALMFTTSTAADPTTGDGDLDVVVYYTIEDVNT